MTGTRIRLSWETRLDQLTLAIDLALLGIGLLLAGLLVHWHGWLGHTVGVLLIIVGAIFCLFDGVRLLGWRTLLWARTLQVDAKSISDDSKKSPGFRMHWSDLKALAVVDDPGRPGLLLVFFPRSRSRSRSHDHRLTHYAGFAPAGWPQPLSALVPRKAGIVDAILTAAPDTWQQHRSDSWAALVAAPGEQVKDIPAPPAAEPAERVDVGTEIAWQGLIGGALALFFGVVAYLGAFGVLPSTGPTAIFLVVGTPFLLIGLATLLSIPMLVRRRWVVLDKETLTWADPTEESFAVAWTELSSMSIEIITVQGATLDRHSVHIFLVPADPDFGHRHPEMDQFADNGRYLLPLGDVPKPAQAIASACRRFAPGQVWQGLHERTGTIAIT